MTNNERSYPETASRVIPWRRRATSLPDLPAPLDRPQGASSAPGDLSRYEGADDRDDYRHRMMTNVLAFVFCAALVLAGIWLVGKLAEIRKNQDCVLSGRRSCTPVEVPARDRW